jgi:putative iron-regulated protein
MKRKILLFASASALLMSSCKKETIDNKPEDFGELKTRVMYNFADDVASRTYGDINNAALKLHTSIQTFEIGFYNGIYDINLEAAKSNWKVLHRAWELSDAFQYGPVNDGKFNEKIDTWPINIGDLNNLLSGSNPLEVSDIENLPSNLRGMHALEYMLFGANGNRDASKYLGRELKYMVSLSKDIQNNCQKIHTAWIDGSNSYAANIVYTTKGGKIFSTKKDLFSLMVSGMNNSCKKVVSTSLGNPYEAVDSTIIESCFSNMSLVDIRNNFNSVMNVYKGRYSGSEGYGIKDLVKEKNSGLNSKLEERMTAVDKALTDIKMPLDSAIYFKRPDVKIAIDAFDSLRSTIDLELTKFVKDNITD